MKCECMSVCVCGWVEGDDALVFSDILIKVCASMIIAKAFKWINSGVFQKVNNIYSHVSCMKLYKIVQNKIDAIVQQVTNTHTYTAQKTRFKSIFSRMFVHSFESLHLCIRWALYEEMEMKMSLNCRRAEAIDESDRIKQDEEVNETKRMRVIRKWKREKLLAGCFRMK